MTKNQKGFSTVEVVIVLVVVGLLVSAGIFIAGRQNADTTTKASTQTPKVAGQSKKPQTDTNQYIWSTTTQGPYQDKIAYATSTDLLNWTDSGKVVAEHSSVPDIMMKNGVLYMYFVDVNTDGKPEQIGLKTSSDKGVTWSTTTIVTIDGLGDEVAVDPDPFLLPDGRIRLYYYVTRSRDPNDASKHSVYSAVSSDGKTFKQEKGVRFTKEQIVDPDVIQVGNVWRMYVGANGQILATTSTDGLTFNYEGVAAQGGVPNVYYDGSRYILYSAGVNVSTSNDGKTFTSLTQGQFKAFPGADPGVVKLGDNSYLMVYKINGNSGKQNPPNQP